MHSHSVETGKGDDVRNRPSAVVAPVPGGNTIWVIKITDLRRAHASCERPKGRRNSQKDSPHNTAPDRNNSKDIRSGRWAPHQLLSHLLRQFTVVCRRNDLAPRPQRPRKRRDELRLQQPAALEALLGPGVWKEARHSDEGTSVPCSGQQGRWLAFS